VDRCFGNLLMVVVALLVATTVQAVAQVVPSGAITMTTQEAWNLRTAILDLTRGNCRWLSPPAIKEGQPTLPDTRTCDKFKLGSTYGPLTVDLTQLNKIIKDYGEANDALMIEKFGQNRRPEPLNDKASSEEKVAAQKRLDEYNAHNDELMNHQPHPITLEHIKYADLHVGDLPDNPISPDVLSRLLPILDGINEPPTPEKVRPDKKNP
jgi:hypothetical protein